MVPSCKNIVLKLTEMEEGHASWAIRTGIRVHLSYCKHCRRYVNQMRAMQRALRVIAEEDAVAANVEAALLERFAAWHASKDAS